MLNKLKPKIKNYSEFIALSLLIIITIIFTSYYNYNKKKIYNNYKDIIDNVYLKKTVNYLLDNLEPKFKKISHKVSPGETFDNILGIYSIDQAQILQIKNKLSKKTLEKWGFFAIFLFLRA